MFNHSFVFNDFGNQQQKEKKNTPSDGQTKETLKCPKSKNKKQKKKKRFFQKGKKSTKFFFFRGSSIKKKKFGWQKLKKNFELNNSITQETTQYPFIIIIL